METSNLRNCILCTEEFEEWYIKDVPQKACKRCDALTNETNRSFSQSKELFNMVGGDINKLIEVEGIIKKNGIFYFPTDLKEIGYEGNGE